METKTVRITIVDIGATFRVRPNRVWTGVQTFMRVRERRAMRYRAWERGTLTSIRRLDGGCAYTAPGDYEITTRFDTRPLRLQIQ